MPLSPLFLAVFAMHGQSTDYADTWKKVDSAIRGRYYARVQREAEMDRLLKKYEPLAKAAKTKDEFRDTVKKMIVEFKDSHFDLLTEADQGYYMMDSLLKQKNAAQMPNIGAWFKKVSDDGYTVQMVLEGSSAEKAGLRKGDLVMTINGKPFSPVASLAESVGKKATLHVSRKGQSLDMDVEVSKQIALDMFLDASKASAKIIEKDGKKYGYFHLWTQASEDFKTALSNAVYGKLSKTDGFILDLRDGFGGRPEGYADPFFRPELNLTWNSSPTVGFTQLFGYGRPLVTLINEGSRSAKEILSYILKKSKRSTLVGSTTAGHVLGTFPQRLTDWCIIEIPIVDVLADGVRIEGHGVAPDVALPNEFDAQNKDLVIEAGLKQLAKIRH